MPPTSIADLSVAVVIVVAAAVFVVPVVFLAVLTAAIVQRSRTGSIGRVVSALLAASGGAALGVLLLVSADPLLQLPIFLAIAALAFAVWRRRRRVQAGWFVAGAALPWTILWGWYVLLLVAGVEFQSAMTLGAFALGAVPLAAGVLMAMRGDPPLPDPDLHALPGQPGSRSFGSIAEAIRDAARIGPFPLPELTMLVALVVVGLSIPFWLPPDAPAVVRVVVPALVAAVIATEVYVRAWPSASRRAFEAFSWLGEWELASARSVSGGGVPSSPAGAKRWLRRPERAEELPLRIEILVFAGRFEDARAALARLPVETPSERFSVAALRDLVEWHAGRTGDVAAMEAAARELLPADGDERLRAEVSIAVAKVRRRMAGGVTGLDAVAPLLEVRERLGTRADGQIGRALRRRILPVLLVLSLGLGVLGSFLTTGELPGQ